MRFIAVLALALLALGGCGQPKQIYVSDGFVRLAAVPGRPAVAYFTLHGGPSDTVLLSVTTEVAIKSELHESMSSGPANNGGMSSMKPIGQIALPAGGKVVFASSGKHVMLFDMNPGVTRGKTAPLIFTFADGLRIQYDATVIAAGDPAPKF